MTTFSKMSWYWSLSNATDLTDTEFRVLVLLANYADGKTGKRAFPSAATLAEQIGKSDKTVRRALAALVTKGWLLKIDRTGKSAEYQLTTPTLDTQMSRVTETNPGQDPGHPDVQGSAGTLDISEGTLDTQMSTHPGHLDVHRSDQGSDPQRSDPFISNGSDRSGQDMQDVQPVGSLDETASYGRSLTMGEGKPSQALEPAEDHESPEGSDEWSDLNPPTAADPWSAIGVRSTPLVSDPPIAEPEALDPWGPPPTLGEWSEPKEDVIPWPRDKPLPVDPWSTYVCDQTGEKLSRV